MRRRFLLLLIPLVVLAILAYVYLRRPGATPIDPAEMAAAETRMWEAYYQRDKTELARALVILLREQFHLSYREAIAVGGDLAAASMAFAEMRGDYERVLPDLERAYARIRDATGADFDPAEVARAELDWWVARRTPGLSSPEEVGRRIARVYALLYGETNAQIEQAGLLRARAAHLRDTGRRSGNVDWEAVKALLEESYRYLLAGTDG